MLMTSIARWRDSAMRGSTARRADRSRGQVIVIFALFLLVLFGAAALTVDYGTWLKARRDYQNVADPAALAGSLYLTRPSGPTERTLARRAAWEEVNRQLGLGMPLGNLIDASNGSTPEGGRGEGDYTIWVASPPNQAGAAYPGAQSSTSRTVFVRIEKDNPAFLSRTMGMGDVKVSAWATAGVFPNRFAVITLREEGMAPPGGANILLQGTNTRLEVIDGDVGGNYNMVLNSSTQLWIRGQGDNDAEVYLIDYQPCGPSCWNFGQVNSGPSGDPRDEPKDPLQLAGPVPDPNYLLPVGINTSGAPTTAVPLGDIGGNVDVRAGGGPTEAPPAGGGTTRPGGVLTCPAGSPKIGPGYYTSITVRAGKCLILDPTARHTSIVAAVPDVATPLLYAAAQMPGIFYVNGDINVENDAMIIGDGVTVIIRPGTNHKLAVSASGVMNLNNGVAGPAMPLGAWTSLGASTYVPGGLGQWQYNSSLESNERNVGVALYVIKRIQYNPGAAVDDNSNVINITSEGGLAWRGITYAPHDNVVLSGQTGHDAIGQLVSWTFKFAGGTKVTQRYEGPEDGVPFLIEPRTGQ